MAFGRWISMATKTKLKKSGNITIQLTFYLFFSTGISLIALNFVSKLQLPWSTWPWWGIFLPNLKK
jgi:hypothetical protein